MAPTSARPMTRPAPKRSRQSSVARARRTGSAGEAQQAARSACGLERVHVLGGGVEIGARQGEDLRPRQARREVDAAVVRVGVGVLEDVDELEPLAEGAGAGGEEGPHRLELGREVEEELGEQLAHDARDDVAVVLEIGERPEPQAPVLRARGDEARHALRGAQRGMRQSRRDATAPSRRARRGRRGTRRAAPGSPRDRRGAPSTQIAASRHASSRGHGEAPSTRSKAASAPSRPSRGQRVASSNVSAMRKSRYATPTSRRSGSGSWGMASAKVRLVRRRSPSISAMGPTSG